MSEDKTDKELVEETERKSHNVLQREFPKNIPVTIKDPSKLYGIASYDSDFITTPSTELLKNIIAQLNGDHDFSKDPRLASLRIEALKIATEMALKINHFEPDYSIKKDPIEAVLNDVDIVHKIADRNLKYIMGEQE